MKQITPKEMNRNFDMKSISKYVIKIILLMWTIHYYGVYVNDVQIHGLYSTIYLAAGILNFTILIILIYAKQFLFIIYVPILFNIVMVGFETNLSAKINFNTILNSIFKFNDPMVISSWCIAIVSILLVRYLQEDLRDDIENDEK